jgi:hypothetical protein
MTDDSNCTVLFVFVFLSLTKKKKKKKKKKIRFSGGVCATAGKRREIHGRRGNPENRMAVVERQSTRTDRGETHTVSIAHSPQSPDFEFAFLFPDFFCFSI